MTRKSLVDYYYQEAGRKSMTSSDWPFFQMILFLICSYIHMFIYCYRQYCSFWLSFSIALKYEPAPKECNEAMSAARKRLKELDKSKRK